MGRCYIYQVVLTKQAGECARIILREFKRVYRSYTRFRQSAVVFLLLLPATPLRWMYVSTLRAYIMALLELLYGRPRTVHSFVLSKALVWLYKMTYYYRVKTMSWDIADSSLTQWISHFERLTATISLYVMILSELFIASVAWYLLITSVVAKLLS